MNRPRHHPRTARSLNRTVAVASLLFALGTTTAACPGEIPEPENEAPIARLLYPQLWPIDEAAPFDASSSFDFDGDIVRVTMTFGDGTPEISVLDGVFEHLYPGPGSFEVRVEIEDDTGAQAEALGTIVIAERVDEPACTCALPCFGAGACASTGRCFEGSQSADEADVGPPPSPPEVLSCEIDG